MNLVAKKAITAEKYHDMILNALKNSKRYSGYYIVNSLDLI